MDAGDKQTIEVPALGRPFSLGTFYDCYRDVILPGLSLWDCEDLLKHVGERPQYYSDFEIIASDSIEEKSSTFNVDGSLKLKMLSGTLEVEGSAKYLTHNKTSKHQARVTLKYEATTMFQEMSMNHLGRENLKHMSILQDVPATHVVTAILYGAKAFFVFDREVTKEENYIDIQGDLKASITMIPSHGKGSITVQEKDSAAVEKFECKFYGDFVLKKNPTTFQDAVEVYQDLPKLLLTNKENVVPVKVWLLPLTCLEPTAARLVRQINTALVQKVQSVLEDFNDLEIRCNDALKTTVSHNFPEICRHVKTFKHICYNFKTEFQQTLAEKLPSIQRGEIVSLSEIQTPFHMNRLMDWLDLEEKEIEALKCITNPAKNVKTVHENTFQHEILNADQAVCFVFKSVANTEVQFSTLSSDFKEMTHTNVLQTFSSILDTVGHKAKLFADFAEANKENNKIKFLAVGVVSETETGASIYLFKEGCLVTKNFEPLSKFETVTQTDYTHNSVTLNIYPPRFGAKNITSYSIEYRTRDEDKWQHIRAPAAKEITVSNLIAGTEYTFRCRAVTSAGVGPARKLGSRIKTRPTSPPEKLQAESKEREIAVSWEKPDEVDKSVTELSYVVEYTKLNMGKNEKDPQWNTIKSRSETVTISELQPETDYIIRVRCDCGKAGQSKESVPLHIHTKKCMKLIKRLKDISSCLKSEFPSVYQLPLTQEDTGIAGCTGYSFGRETSTPNHTIILLGATGSGKSTLINAMINYIIGVDFEDDIRFKLTEENPIELKTEKTSQVTVYKIYHHKGFRIPFSLTVVDTPGFLSPEGIERDRGIKEQISKLFSSTNGIREIDAVCFVAPAATSCTPSLKYVFDSTLSVFGKDVADNIKILVTFADGSRPLVLKSINALKVPCQQTEDTAQMCFQFNNSGLFEGTVGADSRLSKAIWTMNAKSMKTFFYTLRTTDGKSLTLTNEVFRARAHLEMTAEMLQKQVQLWLAQQKKINEIREKLNTCEAELNRTKNFEVDFIIRKPVQCDISSTGHYSANCLQCNYTCHYPCFIENDNTSHECTTIKKRGYCIKCPGKCKWDVHCVQKHKWDYEEYKGSQTIEELKDQYLKAREVKAAKLGLIEKLRTESNYIHTGIEEIMESCCATCLKRLERIALRPNPLFDPENFDIFIEEEKSEAKPGWRERVQSLKVMRKEAEYMCKISRESPPTIAIRATI
ncbi:uncharacterized protein KZ484_014444 [Pholidichthys leucotaenia]